MKHVRMLWICIVAALAIGGLAATSASALPEWGQCFKIASHEGKYANAVCTVKAKVVNTKNTGEFEFRKNTEIANKKFSNAGGASKLDADLIFCSPGFKRLPACAPGESESSVEIPITCSSESSAGETAGTKEVKNVVLTFTGCSVSFIGTCSNTATAGEVVYNSLKGSLGYINKSKKEAGLLLEPAAKKHPFVAVTCGPETYVIGVGSEAEGAAYAPSKTGGFDGVIAPITPVNTMGTSFTESFVGNAAFENVPSHFEGKHIDLLEGYGIEGTFSTKWSKVSLALTNTTTTVEEYEIKA